ncbi:hypothetical protein IWX76_002662 [Pedobacter sp. CAN_A7]|uniref:hypothetical protein n=1 Tax=Pedobacter sp. CAN_A7 TaxID=2787722 RepID=UPI0018C93A50
MTDWLDDSILMGSSLVVEDGGKTTGGVVTGGVVVGGGGTGTVTIGFSGVTGGFVLLQLARKPRVDNKTR